MTAAPPITLAEFILARVAEGERRAKDQYIASMYDGWTSEMGTPPSADEIEAKLRGTLQWAGISMKAEVERLQVALAAAFRAVPLLKAQAAKHADHPDYRPEWRP